MPSNSKRKPKDDEQSVVSENKQPIKSVPALMGEGEKFYRDQLYSKAIECYTEVKTNHYIILSYFGQEYKSK
jgi:hypothetical protein